MMSRRIGEYEGKSEREIFNETMLFHINDEGYIGENFFKTGPANKHLFALICLTICPPAYYTLISEGESSVGIQER